MVNYFVTRKYFYAIYCILLIVLTLIYFTFTKEELFFTINGNNTLFLDYFFFLVTELGNAWTYILFILGSLIFPRRLTFMLLTGLLLSTFFAQGLKHFVFEHAARPLLYFKESQPIHHLSYTRALYHHSFPSGHTVSVFTLITLLVAIFSKRKYDLLLLSFALLTAYSRVYLGHHFYEDVLFGSFIGVVSGTIVIYFFRNELKYNIPFIKSRFTS